jgi:hypothetical protein
MTGQEEVNQQEEIPKSNHFAVMMNASRQQALRKMPNAGDLPSYFQDGRCLQNGQQESGERAPARHFTTAIL